ncbi:pyrimidine reductase family protein [Corynebacterium breve]|uniref:Pyrimidine reductase family protein n=1 Tax=Corynebacterium breve TaxID=3049799 RepID=A0ABY8VHH4_9CORY|nr:pyrimidine reductase family protein [Corynebacterium breve]WIM68969.1 pyrimidine reductase family protein [Corynebacterium breve]
MTRPTQIAPAELMGPVLPSGVAELRAIAVATLSGAVSVDGRSHTLGNATDFALLNALRDWSDVVLVGANTARAENYFGVRSTPEQRRARALRGQAEIPPIATIARSLEFDTSAQLFWNTAVPPVILAPHASLTDDRLAYRRAQLTDAGAELVDTGSGSAAEIVAALRDRGFARITCEGGPEIYSLMFHAGVVDKLHLTLAPLVNAPVEHNLLAPRPDGTPYSQEIILEDARATDDSLLFLRYGKKRA